LDVSRIATGRLRLSVETFDLVEAAREVAERLRDSATSGGCELVIDAGSSIVGRWDRLRIEQVLMNLISNSIKYASGHPIHVAVVGDAAGVALRVRDRGPGIPEADQSRIFERFERALSSRHYGGMGLGLYVA